MTRSGHQKVRPNVRWNDETERLLQAAADACGVSKAQFIRETILMRAILVLEEHPVPGDLEVARMREISRRIRHLESELDD